MKGIWITLAVGLALASAVSARAEERTLEEMRAEQAERLRAEVAAQIQLQAMDLLDELVFRWTRTPPFTLETKVLLAGVSVPVGFGSGLEAMLENHFTNLVLKNPTSKVALVHCPICTASIVRSGAKGTIIARGVDEPEALAAAGVQTETLHALFLDFEVEGSSLTLRARITGLSPSLPIEYAQTLTTSTSAPALLRSPDQLKSAAEARKEYLDALMGRSMFTFPFRLGYRQYAASDSSPIATQPLVWLEAGVEMPLTQARAWLGSLSFGASWLPDTHTAWMGQARLSRLLSGSATSLTAPDLYGFVGGSVVTVKGVTAAVFKSQTPDISQVLGLLGDQATFGTFQVGLEARVKNRIGVALFVESLPLLDAEAIGDYLDLGIVTFRSLGVEVVFCF